MNPIYARLPHYFDCEAPLTVLEIGAADGGDTRRLRFTFPHARIYAFEPDPRNTYLIRRDKTDELAEVVEAAVGDRDGTAEFQLSSGAPPKGHPLHGIKTWSYSSSLRKPAKHLEIFPWVKFDRTARVRIVKLDTFAAEQNLGVIDFIWADVQGAEDQVVAGGQIALQRTRYVYTEFNREELYAGQKGLDEIMAMLPGHWEIAERFGSEDVLLRNVTLTKR
ncbi:MAG: FkbM family methyltransferase [Phycisphaerales bacterium]